MLLRGYALVYFLGAGPPFSLSLSWLPHPSRFSKGGYLYGGRKNGRPSHIQKPA